MNMINKISALAGKLLSMIGIDGIAHIIVCQNLVMWLSKYIPLWLAVAITVAIFILKEIYDKYNNGTVDVLDSLATTIGALIGFWLLF